MKNLSGNETPSTPAAWPRWWFVETLKRVAASLGGAALPHPSPLPLGEGAPLGASRPNLRLHWPDALPDCEELRGQLPSPSASLRLRLRLGWRKSRRSAAKADGRRIEGEGERSQFFKAALFCKSPRWAATLLLLGTLTGCDRGAIKTYRVAKETAAPAEHNHAAPAPGEPRLTWKTPAAWTEVAPGEMRLASFNVKTADGKLADISVIPLPGLAGGDAPNVNRWRGQVGLPAATPEEIDQAAESVTIGGQPAKLYNLGGTNTASGDATRILAAISTRGDTTWFFKITGDDALVSAQKTAMVEFLQSLDFNGSAPAALPPNHPPIGGNPMTPAPATGPISREGQPTWQVPAGWTEVPGGQFLVAKFTIAGADAATAAVNVSRSAGEGGGLAGNVNRWRKQLGLAEISAAEIQQAVKPIAGGPAMLVEISGPDAQVVGAIVPQNGATWFYKLMGATALVESQKAAFVKFVSEVKY